MALNIPNEEVNPSLFAANTTVLEGTSQRATSQSLADVPALGNELALESLLRHRNNTPNEQVPDNLKKGEKESILKTVSGSFGKLRKTAKVKIAAAEQLEREIHHLQELNNDFKAQLLAERDINKKLRSELEANRELVDWAQSSTLSAFLNRVSVKLPDDEVQKQLEAIFTKAQEWTIENSIKVQSLTEKDKIEIRNMLIKREILAPDENVDTDVKFYLDSRIAVNMALESLLIDEVCYQFLRHPYFIAKLVPSLSQQRPREVLRKLEDLFKAGL